ncbi:MAG: response regulator [Deltaproteobacteria bacterium]
MIRVLCVDDRDDERYLLRRRLGRIGVPVTITEADSATAAARSLAEAAFDVVFLDVSMPVVSGIDFLPRLAELLADGAHLAVPAVVFYTASVDPADQETAFQYPFVRGFLSKEAALDEVRDVLMRAVEPV